MNALIIAAEAAHAGDPPGDEWTAAAWILTGIACVYAAVATIMVTKRAHHDEH